MRLPGQAESASSPTKAKVGAKNRAYERTEDDDEEAGSRNDEDDEDDDEEEEEDEESGSSSLDEGLEKRFRQYLRTPEGIAAVLVMLCKRIAPTGIRTVAHLAVHAPT